MKRKYGTWIVSICMMAALLFVFSIKAEAGNVTSGTIGDHGGISWTYDESSKTLTITGEDTGTAGDWEIGSIFNQCGISGVEIIRIKNCKMYDCTYLFAYMSNLKWVFFENFDTSECTSMYGMFAGCYRIEILNLSSLNTSNVTDMSYMFMGCENLYDLNLKSFNTSNVTAMDGMFQRCLDMKWLDLSSFDTSKVTQMRWMFQECTSLQWVDVSSFDTSQVSGMNGMFSWCEKLSTVDVSGFNTSKVRSMHGMFEECYRLESVDVSGFDTSNLQFIGGMFANCRSLEALDMGRFDLKNMNMEYEMNYSNVLTGCDSLTLLYTPIALKDGLEIALPSTFEDELGNSTQVVTKDFCNKILSKPGMRQRIEQVSDFVERMYTIVLGRAAEVKGSNDWTMRLLTLGIDGATLVDMFVNSDEFVARNTSDEEYIKILYRAVLGREADEGGLQMWKDMLADDWTRDYVMEGLVLSTEFENICNSYGITAAFEPTEESQVRSFVKRMYTVVLNRRADAVGLEDWTRHLLNGVANGAQVADGFINSQEFANRNLSDEKYVKVLYRAFFNREADAEGYAVWMGELAKGVSRRDVMKGFVHSVEFSDLCAQYGIIRGEIQ